MRKLNQNAQNLRKWLLIDPKEVRGADRRLMEPGGGQEGAVREVAMGQACREAWTSCGLWTVWGQGN
jgi:hypothetical protein